ncbi:MAG: peptide synthase [Deltaproteobacteria bacterium SG8_13]|nr:MAG: peptide synthase [Deltaproteobacteria bacterium SG8_13]
MNNQKPPSSDNDRFNIASHLRRMARVQPYKKAAVCPAGRDRNGRMTYAHLTFRQLDCESDAVARGLSAAGMSRGTRTVVMVPPGLEFFSLVFALFKTGAVPVVVDPGMGIRRMVACFRESDPSAFIGIPKAHILRGIYPRFFRSVQTWITVGRRWLWGGHTLKRIRQPSDDPFPIAGTDRHEMAAILFTTGSTGPAKGVIYTHGIFDAQIARIKTQYGIATDEIDLPTFPLFALFDPALGMTAVIPDMDPTRPADVDPTKIIEAINDHGVTNMFASPALLNRVGAFGKRNGIVLPSLKRVISAGAPVQPSNLEQFSALLMPDADIHTGYGATEAMPVASISGREILSETRFLCEQGLGVCVGQPINGIEVRLAPVTEQPIPDWKHCPSLEKGAVGEITVKGDIVTRSYYKRPQTDALAKIRDGDSVWHRMGDLGRFDEQGRIWFFGRKSHRVITETDTLYTIPCEAIFNNHDKVNRSALVGVGRPPHQKPVICIELHGSGDDSSLEELKQELLSLGRSHAHTRGIDTVLFHDGFPVDIRHNSKIFREKLSVWAAKQLSAKD